jgi:serine/threonine protein kinase
VKKLRAAGQQGAREFLAEMETLGRVEHANLVPLLGYCASGGERVLVYEYMPNGSLDAWLRTAAEHRAALDWRKRVRIAAGSARGLAFLHHGFAPHGIVHRDVKSSNVLLDAAFEPRVADFGLARAFPGIGASASETHVTTGVAGTLGYIPPEYATSGRASRAGDVFSYGVILLELLTGREPTGPDFREADGGNLVGWAREMVRAGRLAQLLDPSLVASVADPDPDPEPVRVPDPNGCRAGQKTTGDGPTNVPTNVLTDVPTNVLTNVPTNVPTTGLTTGPTTAKLREMLHMLRVALLCTSDNPFRRPTMLQVVEYLREIVEPHAPSCALTPHPGPRPIVQ